MMLTIGIAIGFFLGFGTYPYYLRRLSKIQTRIRQIQHGQRRMRKRA